MVRYENHCCGCQIPCIGSSCSLLSVPVAYCDRCDCEADEFYDTADGLLCEDCYIETELKAAEKVEGSGECAFCGEETDERYMLDGEAACHDCFIEALREADTVSVERVVEKYC